MISGRPILVDNVRVRGVGRSCVDLEQDIGKATSFPVPEAVGENDLFVYI